MAASFKLAEAYVELRTRGSLAQDIQRQKGALGTLSAALSTGAIGKYVKYQERLSELMASARSRAGLQETIARTALLNQNLRSGAAQKFAFDLAKMSSAQEKANMNLTDADA